MKYSHEIMSSGEVGHNHANVTYFQRMDETLRNTIEQHTNSIPAQGNMQRQVRRPGGPVM